MLIDVQSAIMPGQSKTFKNIRLWWFWGSKIQNDLRIESTRLQSHHNHNKISKIFKQSCSHSEIISHPEIISHHGRTSGFHCFQRFAFHPSPLWPPTPKRSRPEIKSLRWRQPLLPTSSAQVHDNWYIHIYIHIYIYIYTHLKMYNDVYIYIY